MRLIPKLSRQTEEDRVSNEAILNVFRRADDPLLTTAEVADAVDLTPEWTSKRLQKLESKGRVHSKSAGQGRVWSLDESEPSFPVREGIGDVLWYISQIREASTTSFWLGGGMFGVSGLFALVLLISYLESEFFFQFYTSDDVVTVMWFAAIFGFLFILTGGMLRLVAIGIPHLVAE